MKHRFTAALERFSRAMLAPLTYLSAAGLLLAAGALLTSTALSGALPLLQWGPVRLMGRILYKCLSAVISNLSVLFCTGLAASLAKQEKHQAAFIALMSYFIYLTAGNVTLAELGLLAQPDGSVRCRPDQRAGHPDRGYRRVRRRAAGPADGPCV